MSLSRYRSASTPAPADPRVLRPVRQIALAGLAAVLVWPAARGDSLWLGWLPLWLVGMPAVAWWALQRFPLPAWPRLGRLAQRRRRGPQARRRRQGGAAAVQARAA